LEGKRGKEGKDLRGFLRSLGYLDSPIERYFVKDLTSKTSFILFNLKISLRVAAIGGFIIGLLMAGLSLIVNPEFLSRPRDIFVLAFYFVVSFFILFALFEFLGGLLVAGFYLLLRGRLAHPLIIPRRLGLFFSFFSFIYLTLWFRWEGGYFLGGMRSFPLVLLVFGLILLFSFALGRFVSFLGVAVLRRMESSLSPEGRERRTLYRYLVVLVLASAFFFGYLFLTSRERSLSFTKGEEFNIIPTKNRVAVIGIDGMEEGYLRLLIKQGKLPNFARLLNEGSLVPLIPFPERIPPLVWTTISTGMSPSAHGIREFRAKRIAGLSTSFQRGIGLPELYTLLNSLLPGVKLTAEEPVSAWMRKTKAIWDIIGEKKLPVGVVNWWASWPAYPITGFIVSDRTYPKFKIGGGFEEEVFPAELFPKLKRLFYEEGKDFTRLFPLFFLSGKERTVVLEAMREDRYYLSVGARLYQEEKPLFFALYLPGLDIVRGVVFSRGSGDLSTFAERISLIEAYYRFLDDEIGQMVSVLPPDVIVVIVADPGRIVPLFSSGRGALLIKGPVVKKGVRAMPATEFDIAPTLLYLLGFPVSEEMKGRVLKEVIAPRFLSELPLRWVRSFGTRSPEKVISARSRFDREMIERLRALGYIR